MQTDDNSLSITDNNSTHNDAVKNDTAKKVVIKINYEYKQLISPLTSEKYEVR